MSSPKRAGFEGRRQVAGGAVGPTATLRVDLGSHHVTICDFDSWPKVISLVVMMYGMYPLSVLCRNPPAEPVFEMSRKPAQRPVGHSPDQSYDRCADGCMGDEHLGGANRDLTFLNRREMQRTKS